MNNRAEIQNKFELPSVYALALFQVTQSTGKSLNSIIKEAVDLWVEKQVHIINPSNIYKQSESLVSSSDQLPPISSPLTIIPTSEGYSLIFETDFGYLQEQIAYSHLAKALDRIQEYEQMGQIDLKTWSPLQGEYPIVILQKQKGLQHLWSGQNTFCKILNKKFINPNDFKLLNEIENKDICKLCIKTYKTLKTPKIQLEFDSKNQFIFQNQNHDTGCT